MVKMHEFSIAEDVIKSILKEAKKHDVTKVKKIFLEMGELAMINTEQLLFALEVLSGGTIAEGMEVDIQMLPVTIKCANKHKNQVHFNEQDLYTFILKTKCPDCGGSVEISDGKGLILKKISAE